MCKYQNLMAKISPLGNSELFQFWKEKKWTPFWKLTHPKKKKSLKNGKKKDAQAKGILTCSMTDSLVALILTCKTSKEIWKALHARYEGDKRKIIIEARNDVSRLVMKREEKWEDYLYRAERLLEQARNLGADIEDEEFITSVIRGLPHKYNLIVLQLSNQEKLTIFDLRNSLKLYDERFSNDTNGASSHMTFHLAHLKNIQAMNKKITLADDSYITSESIGDVEIKNSDEESIILKDVLYVPKLSDNLISVSKLIQDKKQIIFDNKGGHIQNEEVDILLTASKIEDFYIINEGNTCLPPTPKPLKIIDTSWDIWHKRLGHINEEYLKMMQNNALVHKFNCNTRKDLNCVTCTQNNSPENLLKKSNLINHPNLLISYMLISLESYFTTKGIEHQKTTFYSPEQNGRSERANRSLIEGTRAFLIEAELPTYFWAEAMDAFTYIKNRTPSRHNKRCTPEDLFTGRKPTIGHLKIFGCLSEMWTPKHKRSKFGKITKTAIFVGYSNNRKAYRICNPQDFSITETRDVKFFETRKGSELLNQEKYKVTQNYTLINLGDEDSEENYHPSITEAILQENASSPTQQHHYDLRPHHPGPGFYYEPSLSDVEEKDNDSPNSIYQTGDTVLKTSHQGYSIPNCYKEAMNIPDSEKWIGAMEKELDSLREHSVWTLQPLPKGSKVIKSKWIYTIKKDATTQDRKYKARLVATGYQQRYGQDYKEIFSPVIKNDSLKVILAFAAIMQYDIKCFDIVTAYLYGNLEETIYMKQPEGFEVSDKSLVCKLNQAIYGLKQSDKLNARFKPCTYSPIVLASSRKLLASETVETYFKEKMDLLNQTSLKKEEKIQLLTDGLPLNWRDVFAAAQPADPTKWIQVALSVEHNRQQSKLRNLFKPKVCTLSQQERSASNCPFFCPICMKKRIKVKHWLNECPDYDPNYKAERSSKNTQPKQFITTVTESTTSNETNKVACLSTNNPPFKLIDFKICGNKHPLQAFMDTDSPMQIQQANSLTKTLGYVHVNLQIHNKTRKVKLHVIPDLKFHLLIGLDIAEDFELIVDTKDKTVYTKQSAEMALFCTTFNHLQKPNQDELNKLLQENEQIFSQHQTDIGRISFQHNIVTKEHLPISLRPYRRPISEYEKISEQVKEMIKKGLIKESSSP
ncbi:hypothetical protein LAZ67_3002548 [Cordylochernes scorpioides]|uniref:Integrase catalytic domain-containing protein n=1 Tax=Cordylochernes scorpioides TaxID=51811 RepID=A0ABY6KCK1_9ARAC|nr:hypothetical protein LAZ67_3002548 [Cordylochernes scorpioides]